MAVFFCHLVPYWGLSTDLPSKLPQVFELGAHGVDVFIVVSGFCLALPVVSRKGQLPVRQFYGRRAVRILPPYYVALIGASILATAPATWQWVVSRQATPLDVTWYALLVQPWTGSVGAVNGSLWSVALEVHLYLLFPLLVLWWKRWGLPSLVMSSAVLCAVWVLVVDVPEQSTLVVPARIVQFVIGMWCADRLLRGGLPSTRRLAAIAAALGLGSALASTADSAVASLVLWGATGGSLVLLAAGPLGRRLSATRLERWGRGSYSFYLVHQPVLLVTGTLAATLGVGTWARFALGSTAALVAAAAVGLVLHVAVERPAQRLSRRVGTRTRSDSGASSITP